MIIKKTKTIVEHVIYDFFGNGNLSKYEEWVEKNVKVHYPPSWKEISSPDLFGREQAKTLDQTYASAFQVKKIEISDILIDEDKVLVRWDFNAIHKGNFFDIKASHRDFDLTGQTIYKFTDKDQIAEVWQAWDLLGLFEQIREEKSVKDIDKLRKLATSLSQKERECMKYLLLGKTAKETAISMNLSFRTVEYYFENIKNKLNCFSKRDLFSLAHLLEKHRIL